ncbi:MAG: ECF-type sigma factor [Bryobacteraceae bacterium]
MNLATTDLLREIGLGNRAVVDQLFAIVYNDLRARAASLFRSESAGHTLQPTALVNEAYFRLIDQRQANWKSRAHFCGLASMAMRRILVDHARKKGAQRRGAGLKMPLDESIALSMVNPDDVLFVHELIENLRAKDENQSKILEMRFFGDLTVEEVAETLGMSKRAVEAEWTMIRATIRSQLSQTGAK